MKKNILCLKTAILVIATSSILILSESGHASSADGEYSVAYWGQTHRHIALKIYHSLTPEQIQKICTHPARNRSLIKNSSLLKEWTLFYQDKRAAFCKSHPQKTWKLLGESPYFMLAPRDGDQK